MIGRVALLVTFKKAKPKPQSLSRSHIRDLYSINSGYGTLHCSPLFRHHHFCLVITDPLNLILKQNIGQ
jgi:hypothetical protein